MDVCEWLTDILQGGPKDTREVSAAAKKAGISRSDLKKARQICGVITTNNWSPTNPADTWYWSLPEDQA